MSYIWRERRADGSIRTERRHDDGRVELVNYVSATKTSNKHAGAYWQLSKANGIIGSKRTVKKAVKLARSVGAPEIDYVQVEPGVWLAGFKSPTEKRRWLKAHKRVDTDAGYGDPCPGQFRDECPPECPEPRRPTVEEVKQEIRKSVDRAWSQAGGNPFRRR